MFLVSLFQSACHAVQMYVSTLGLRSDQQTCECAAKLDVKAAFASLDREIGLMSREDKIREKVGEVGVCSSTAEVDNLRERERDWS